MKHGTFVGWIGDDVLHSLYAIADVCVVPSIYEPFGLVALEAMAIELPVHPCCADTGGLREVVPDEVGLRFRARDPESLAEMTIQVLEDAQHAAAAHGGDLQPAPSTGPTSPSAPRDLRETGRASLRPGGRGLTRRGPATRGPP